MSNVRWIDDQDQQQQQLLQQKRDIYNIWEISLIIFKSTIMMDKDIGEKGLKKYFFVIIEVLDYK
jgi:hypothetical protein